MGEDEKKTVSSFIDSLKAVPIGITKYYYDPLPEYKDETYGEYLKGEARRQPIPFLVESLIHKYGFEYTKVMLEGLIDGVSTVNVDIHTNLVNQKLIKITNEISDLAFYLRDLKQDIIKEQSELKRQAREIIDTRAENHGVEDLEEAIADIYTKIKLRNKGEL